jgi:hypothetical protein
MSGASVKLGHLSFYKVIPPEAIEGSSYTSIHLDRVVIIYRHDEGGDWFPVLTLCIEKFVKEYYMLKGVLHHISLLSQEHIPLPLLAIY